MSYSANVECRQPLPGVEILQLDGGLSVHEFEAVVPMLTIPRHLDMTGAQIEAKPATQLGDTIIARRMPEKPRDPWAPDHHWHSDRTYWGENQFASVLYAQRLLGDVATTGFIDTAALFQTMVADDPGLADELAESNATFSTSRYFEEVLPTEGSPEAIAKTLVDKGAQTLDEVVALETAKYPAKEFPATPIHPFSGERCTMLDDSRVVALSGLSLARSQEIIRRVKKQYLALPVEELEQRPYHYLHYWEEGQAIIYPQVGTLHRAMPSPAGEQQRDTLRLFIA
jgi:alpha-ketoglutarate-dependent taurine dioxygenase